jgi:hypothetical protein
MFDVDDDVPAIMQGIPIDGSSYVPPSPPHPAIYEPYVPPSAVPTVRYTQGSNTNATRNRGIPVYNEDTDNLNTSKYTPVLSHPDRRVVASPTSRIPRSSSPDGTLPLPLSTDSDFLTRLNSLHTTRTQLESLLTRLFIAQRTGDTDLQSSLLRDPSPNRESPINAHVTWFRNAGAIVVNCDVCTCPVPDVHWHCDVCTGGDWDMCFGCRMTGSGCPGGHALVERSAKEWAGERYWTNL